MLKLAYQTNKTCSFELPKRDKENKKHMIFYDLIHETIHIFEPKNCNWFRKHIEQRTRPIFRVLFHLWNKTKQKTIFTICSKCFEKWLNDFCSISTTTTTTTLESFHLFSHCILQYIAQYARLCHIIYRNS